MKQCAAVALILAILVSFAPPARAVIFSGETVKLPFAEGDIPEGVKWSPHLVLTGEHLAYDGRGHDVWVQTQKMPTDPAWRPPVSVNTSLSFDVTGLDEIRAYVRYSCDKLHWTPWHHIPYRGELENHSMGTYEYQLSVPLAARSSYQKLMTEWRQTNPTWPDDQGELCQWIAKNHPQFFVTEFPFIGYLQFRVESARPREGALIRSLSVDTRWAVSGLFKTKKGKGVPELGLKWSFDMRRVREKEIKDEE